MGDGVGTEVRTEVGMGWGWGGTGGVGWGQRWGGVGTEVGWGWGFGAYYHTLPKPQWLKCTSEYHIEVPYKEYHIRSTI